MDVILNGSADPDDEVIPETLASPRTRVGDIWILGEHRVGCGDARDLDFVRRLIGEKAAVDAAFLVPPYNVAFPDMRLRWGAIGNSQWRPVKHNYLLLKHQNLCFQGAP